MLGVGGHPEHPVGWAGPRVLEHSALVRDVHQVGVHGVGGLGRRGDGDTVGLGVGQKVGPTLEVPLPPGRDDLDVGFQRVGRQLEADLVVALAGGAVGDGIGAEALGGLHHSAGDGRAGQGRAHEVVPLVDRVGAHGGEDAVANELLLDVLDDGLDRAGGQRRLTDLVHVLAELPHVRRIGDDLGVVGLS